jgi:ABC-2 type transport system ATP-binding protein
MEQAESNGQAIHAVGLSKRYGSVHAVDHVSFTVEAGEIFGFMGHNGAGKTTTLRMLLGLVRPDAGHAHVLGHDVADQILEVRRLSGYLPADYTLPPDMTARQFLYYIGAMFSLPHHVTEERTRTLLAQFDLTADANRKLRGFSSGMIQRLGLAQALINDPRVLFLDEPTSGLDPLGRYELLQLLRTMSQERGVTIFFSSHILSDIEALCRRAAVIHHGKLIAAGDIRTLKAEHGAGTMDELYLALVRKAAS